MLSGESQEFRSHTKELEVSQEGEDEEEAFLVVDEVSGDDSDDYQEVFSNPEEIPVRSDAKSRDPDHLEDGSKPKEDLNPEKLHTESREAYVIPEEDPERSYADGQEDISDEREYRADISNQREYQEDDSNQEYEEDDDFTQEENYVRSDQQYQEDNYNSEGYPESADYEDNGMEEECSDPGYRQYDSYVEEDSDAENQEGNAANSGED